MPDIPTWALILAIVIGLVCIVAAVTRPDMTGIEIIRNRKE
jgi:hypothetical protein